MKRQKKLRHMAPKQRQLQNDLKQGSAKTIGSLADSDRFPIGIEMLIVDSGQQSADC